MPQGDPTRTPITNLISNAVTAGSVGVLNLAIGSACPASAQTFVDRGAELGLDASGSQAAWGDVDGDGWSDLWTGGAVWLNRRGDHRGDHGRAFERVEAPGEGVIADLDGDGRGDLVSFAPIAVWRTVPDGAGVRFEPRTLPALPETTSRGVAVGDLDGDAQLDLFFGGYEDWNRGITFPSLLLLADGDGFRLARVEVRHRTRGVTACDFDEDGDLDVYLSNYRLQPNELLLNDGVGSFEDAAPRLGAIATSPGFEGGHSIGACWGDLDGDGRFDLLAGNFAHVDDRGDQPKSRVLRNRGGDAGFEDLGERGIWYQESYASPTLGDVDRDGRLDLFFTTVYAVASFGRPNHPVLFRNEPVDGAWTFRDVTAGSGLEALPPTYQAAFADFDQDGRVDLVTAGRLYRNESADGGRWLLVRLVGDGERVPVAAIGSQVRVTLPGGRVVARQVEVGTGQGNSNDQLLHLGLGAVDGPVRVEVRWTDGAVTVLEGVEVDRLIEVPRRVPARPATRGRREIERSAR